VQTLVIEGKAIEADFQHLPLSQVLLDAANPRIQHLLKRGSNNGAPTQQELATLIRKEVAGADPLFAAIRDNRGLQEAIVVRPDGRVIEGNCRVACYMRLLEIDQKNNVADTPWKTIPALVVREISERQVAAYQGGAHVAGKNPWRAYEKAGHIYTMYTAHRMDAKTIGQILRMSEGEVLRDIRAYETMTQKLMPTMKPSDAVEKWSFFAEFFKRKKLEDYRAQAKQVDEFVSLVKSGKLKHGADVRKLEKIFKSKAATKELKAKGVESAMNKLGQADPTADSSTFRQIQKTAKLLKKFPAKDLDRLKDPEARRILQELLSAARAVAKTAGLKVQ
jgi:hypothetical protein